MKNSSRLPRLTAAALAAGVAFATLPALAAPPVIAARFDHDGGDRARGHDRDRGHDDRGRGRVDRDRGHDDRYRGRVDRDRHDDGNWAPALLGALSFALAPQPRTYYAPPPRAYYAPPPPRISYYGSYGTVSAVPASPVYQASNGQYCREYQSTIRVNGYPQASYGTACLGADGAWRIVN